MSRYRRVRKEFRSRAGEVRVESFPEVPERIARAFVSALHQRGLEAGRRAYATAPRETGSYRETMTVASYEEGREVERHGDGAPAASDVPAGTQAATVVGFGFPGRFLEEGTIYMAARPHLGPAMDTVVGEGPGAIEQAMKALG